MTKEEYILLCEKYIFGTCTDEEKQAIEEYQDSFELRDRAWNDILMGPKDVVKRSIYKRLQNNIQVLNHYKISPLIIKWCSIAAVLLIVLFTGLYIRFDQRNPAALESKNLRFKNDVIPGRNKAVLTLDNGSKIVLDDAENGLIAKQGNTEVKKEQRGQLVYSITGNNRQVRKLNHNTVATPLGGQYQIVLPDGSKVWLNAGSSLRFPTAFTGGERRVELSGEAYFEVSKNKDKPFRVLVNDMEVKVLGTHFNIMAYNNEGKINTTLLEGSVEIINGPEQRYLIPGQKAVITKNTRNMDVTPVDVKQEIAWKDGYFIFNNEDIRSIMRKVSRWYNVEVDFEKNLGEKDFVGTISRNKNVSELLGMLELTGVVHFKIEGRRITVMQ